MWPAEADLLHYAIIPPKRRRVVWASRKSRCTRFMSMLTIGNITIYQYVQCLRNAWTHVQHITCDDPRTMEPLAPFRGARTSPHGGVRRMWLGGAAVPWLRRCLRKDDRCGPRGKLWKTFRYFSLNWMRKQCVLWPIVFFSGNYG